MVGSLLMQRILSLLKRLLPMSFDTSAASMQLIPSELQPDELICSFVYNTNHVVNKTNSIHHSRLMPRRRDRKPDGRLETSVCRSHLLSEVQIWEICQTFFDINAPKPAIGRGEGQAETVFKVGLSFDPDGKPYHQHANIVGWHDPGGVPDSDEIKHFWMDQTQRMAPGFRYVQRPAN